MKSFFWLALESQKCSQCLQIIPQPIKWELTSASQWRQVPGVRVNQELPVATLWFFYQKYFTLFWNFAESHANSLLKPTVFKNPGICKYLKAEDGALSEKKSWICTYVEKKVLASPLDRSRCGKSSPIILPDSFNALVTMTLCLTYKFSDFPLFLIHVPPYNFSWCFYENHSPLTLARTTQMSCE